MYLSHLKVHQLHLKDKTEQDLVQKLQDGEPSIWTRVSLDAPRLEIHVFGMGPGEPELVGNAIAAAARGD